MSKVSVIMPYYNLGEYIDEAVESVINQSFTDWELVIVNDGSTDEESIKALEKYKGNVDKRITLYNTTNQGLAAARNFAVTQTNQSTEYICNLDADDRYHKDFLQKTVEFLDNDKQKKYGFITTWFCPFGISDSRVEVKKSTPELLVKNIPHVASLFRREAFNKVNGYDESMKHGYQDWDFWLGIIEAGYDWEVLSEVLFFYRVRADSMLRDTVKRDLENYDYILTKHKGLLKTLGAESVLKDARKVITDYDLTINDLARQNKELREKIDRFEASRLWKIRSKIKENLREVI